jgi:transcription-repair coupling factor (superfamily II helicase)
LIYSDRWVPYRVDLFDDEIDSIRTADPDTQRDMYPVPEVTCRAAVSDGQRCAHKVHTAGANCWRRPDQGRIYKDMNAAFATRLEYLPSAFFRRNRHVFDYLGKMPRWVLHGDLEPAFQRFWQERGTATG